MTARDESVRGPLGFRVGDVVEVRSKEEILATLDEQGELDSLPFMPEMLDYCGQQVRVFRRAVKTCDPGDDARFRRMHKTLHLQDLRCDGSAHGGCEARCLIYWREEWLRPVGRPASSVPPTAGAAVGAPSHGVTEADLAKATRVSGNGSGETVYRCQATEVKRAAPEVIKDWDLRSWVRDVRSGNAGVLQALRVFLVALFNVFQRANQKLLPRLPLIHGAGLYPFVDGRLKTTPRAVLNLRPGEVVRIKSLDEIEATLDTHGRNRGMTFDRNMVKYCDTEARVLGKVDQIIDPKSGRMVKFATDGIVLENIYCQKVLCPKSEYTYWREVWLERVQPDEAATRSADMISTTGPEK